MSQSMIIEKAAYIFKGFKALLAKEFAESSIQLAPTHLKVLRSIQEHQPCSAQVIAELMKRDKAQVNRLLHAFDKEQLIIRKENPNDKRSQLLTITNAGRSLLGRMEAAEKEVIKRMTGELTDEELCQLIKLLEKIRVPV